MQVLVCAIVDRSVDARSQYRGTPEFASKSVTCHFHLILSTAVGLLLSLLFVASVKIKQHASAREKSSCALVRM